jgi:hypothetical protein
MRIVCACAMDPQPHKNDARNIARTNEYDPRDSVERNPHRRRYSATKVLVSHFNRSRNNPMTIPYELFFALLPETGPPILFSVSCAFDL